MSTAVVTPDFLAVGERRTPACSRSPDKLPAGNVNEVLNLPEELVPETRMSLADSLAQAAVEDEGITPEMAVRLDRACASVERGETVPHEEILRDFGLHSWPQQR